MGKKLTQEKIARINLLKQKGYSKVRVARVVGVSEGAVYRYWDAEPEVTIRADYRWDEDREVVFDGVSVKRYKQALKVGDNVLIRAYISNDSQQCKTMTGTIKELYKHIAIVEYDKPVVMQGLVLDKIVQVREAIKITDLMIANEKKEEANEQ